MVIASASLQMTNHPENGRGQDNVMKQVATFVHM